MQRFQSEVLSGLDKLFVDKLMAVGQEHFYEKGTIMFSQGDPARLFYLLVNGRVRLTMGQERNAVYTVCRKGEALGWSSVTGRSSYSASALCMAPSVLLAFHRQDLGEILEADPGNAGLFYKNLAQALGNSLINARARIAERVCVDEDTKYSIDQVQGELNFV